MNVHIDNQFLSGGDFTRFEAIFLKGLFVISFFYALIQWIAYYLDPTSPSMSKYHAPVMQRVVAILILCVATFLLLNRKNLFSKFLWGLVGLASLSRIAAFFAQGSFSSLHERRVWYGVEHSIVAAVSLVILLYRKKIEKEEKEREKEKGSGSKGQVSTFNGE